MPTVGERAVERVTYPVDPPVDADKRISHVARDVRSVFQQHGFWDIDRGELARLLFGFFYGPRGAVVALERASDQREPLVTPGDEIDSTDCMSVAHELRRLRGADGALVIAMKGEDNLAIGLAAAEGSVMDSIGSDIIESLDAVLKKRGWKAPTIQDIEMDFTVGGDEAAS